GRVLGEPAGPFGEEGRAPAVEDLRGAGQRDQQAPAGRNHGRLLCRDPGGVGPRPPGQAPAAGTRRRSQRSGRGAREQWTGHHRSSVAPTTAARRTAFAFVRTSTSRGAAATIDAYRRASSNTPAAGTTAD